MLVRAQRLETVGILAGGLAHDLNNVLAPSLLTAALLKEKLPPEDQWLVSSLETTTQRGMGLLKELMKLMHGVDGYASELAPRLLISSVAKVARGTLPPAIEVLSDYSEDLPSLYGNPPQLCQLLLNLCLEARDAMPAGGALQIRALEATLEQLPAGVDRNGNWLLLAATATPNDSHPGAQRLLLSDDDQEQHADQRRAATATIVEGHGGATTVEPLTGGVEFRAFLPTAQQEETEPAEQAAPPASGTGQKLMIVEDDHAVRRVTCQVLERQGYKTLECASGAEAAALFAQHHRDICVVITNMLMQDEDGPETIRRLQEIDAHVKVIATTGLIGKPEDYGINGDVLQGFLPKPFTAHALLEMLASILADG